jgi:glycosyltransferase involved in cell wall biosynthesis
MPKVSVIIPTYNRAKLVERAINSVLVQTFKDFELFIIDDASTDNTKQIVKKFRDERIKIIHHQKNKGGSAARNTGIKTAIGEYIAFLDDDDEWIPTKLEKQMRFFERCKRNVGLIYSWAEIIDEKKDLFVKSQSKVKGTFLREILERSFLISSTVIVKKACFHSVGLFDENFISCQDREMWTRIATRYEVELLPECLVRYYKHSGISIGTSKKVNYGYYQYFTKFQYFYLQQGMKNELSQHLNSVAYKLAQKGYNEESKECFRLSFSYDKYSWKNYARLFFSLVNRKFKIY